MLLRVYVMLCWDLALTDYYNNNNNNNAKLGGSRVKILKLSQANMPTMPTTSNLFMKNVLPVIV